MVAVDYGATKRGVQGLLVWWDLDGDTGQGSQLVDIDRWLTEGTADVYGRIGDITGLPSEALFKTRAASLVHLYAAAIADDANHPERTGDDRRYAATLWQRYSDGLTQLAADIGEERSGDEGLAEAAHSFPCPPMFSRTMPT